MDRFRTVAWFLSPTCLWSIPHRGGLEGTRVFAGGYRRFVFTSHTAAHAIGA